MKKRLVRQMIGTPQDIPQEGRLMTIIASLGASIFLLFCVILIHFETLELISRYLPLLPVPHRLWIAVIIFCVFLGHIAEIGLFALAYYIFDRLLHFGGFTDTFTPTPLNYFYFSIVSFSTLGLSSFQPTGALKIIAGLEALAGFLLITWSASFGYTAMKDFWQKADEPKAE
jgi:hypothetical protein